MASESKVEIEYPESDGKPMGETDVHRDWMTEIIALLKQAFAGQQVYVSGNLFIYYEEGNINKSVAPDLFVVKGSDPSPRRTYNLWEERKTPNFVLETTSKRTRRRDTGFKRRLFAQLGIAEYFLYDPTCEYLKPPLRGYRLEQGVYVPVDADPDGFIRSHELDLWFGLEQDELVIRTASGDRLLSGVKLAAYERAERAKEKARADRESARADREKARADRESAERAQEKARADRESAERAQEKARAERESQARQAAEAELAKLRAQLERQNRGDNEKH